MQEFIEKLIGRLEEKRNEKYINGVSKFPSREQKVFDIAETIVNQLAEEHKDNVMINEQYCWQTCGATEHCKECNRLCNGSIDYYENYDFMAEEHNNGWIPCSERLPEEKGDYLVTCNDGKVRVWWFVVGEDFKCWRIGVHTLKPIAWQPLPTPYQPKGE